MTVSTNALIINSKSGLYCPQGDFYIDPMRPVRRALITHAHSDHARAGSSSYLTAESGLRVLKTRIGSKASIETIPYGKSLNVDGVGVSFHSAGHVLGSSQIRLEYQGQVWVVSGDYKTQKDPTCEEFEQLRCDCFISESTFALPVYQWPSPAEVQLSMNSWWEENRKSGLASVLYAYSFGKAQRLLAMMDPSIGPVYVHSSIAKINQDYLDSGIKLPDCGSLMRLEKGNGLARNFFKGSILILPPSSSDAENLDALGEYSTAFASGWMRFRKNRRGKNYDRGFVLSDHADWQQLNEVIRNTHAEQVIVTHGYVKQMVRHLQEKGIQARVLSAQNGIEFEKSEQKLESTDSDEPNGNINPLDYGFDTEKSEP